MSLVKKIKAKTEIELKKLFSLNDKLNDKLNRLIITDKINTENMIYDSTSIINSIKEVNEQIEWFLEQYDNNFSSDESKKTYEFQEKMKKKLLLLHVFKSLTT